jgi:hypothetical protein
MHNPDGSVAKGEERDALLKEKQEREGLPPLQAALEILDYLQPTFFFIENPQTSRMKNYLGQAKHNSSPRIVGSLRDLPNFVVHYCRYGFTYQKATRIWHSGNIVFTPLLCSAKDQCLARRWNGGKRHPTNLGGPHGANVYTREAGRVPVSLLLSLFLSLDLGLLPEPEPEPEPESESDDEDPSIIICSACGVKASLDGKHVTGVGVGYDANFCEYCDE